MDASTSCRHAAMLVFSLPCRAMVQMVGYILRWCMVKIVTKTPQPSISTTSTPVIIGSMLHLSQASKYYHRYQDVFKKVQAWRHTVAGARSATPTLTL